MTDAQHLFDFARNQFIEIVSASERHFEIVAGQLREWIPESTFVSRTPPPPKLPPPSTWQIVQRWMSRHKAVTAAMVAFLATGSVGVLMYRLNTKSNRRKRRARKSAGGARTDVVVLAGSPANAMLSVVALDLERRGFIVYVAASTTEEEQYIRSQNRSDLLPLHLDLVDPFTAREQQARFRALLDRDHYAFDGAEPHRLNFCGLVLVPDLALSEAKVKDINIEEWSDALNAKVLNTIATTQHFLPAVIECKANILFLTPSVTPSLQLPGHSMETTIYGALNGFISALSSEMREEAVSVCQFKLGDVDVPSLTAKQKREGRHSSRFKATPVRSLHNAIFDALTSKRPSRTWHVGRGSLAYDIIGSIVPPHAIAWMMGKQRITKAADATDQPIELRDEEMQGSLASITWEKIDDASDNEA